ncbi:transmembrane protein 30C isoform X1 [Scleropages formosus]|uniref:Cell cycle control protein n=1 Tax=Scleropages formosus TaxID=113540 RepID=A0A8C9V2N1_SCLFO|nr:cell cycle control protein 50A-like isoform X1 [Scleropages formosus]
MGKKVAGSGPCSRIPDNSAFKQQRLPAWSPSLTAETVLPFFYIIGLVCVLLGVALFLTVQKIQEIQVDYTTSGTCDACFEMRSNKMSASVKCRCSVDFSLKENFQEDVFLYYGLVNFHQNLRRYMDSRDDGQLVGRTTNLKNPSTYCEPFAYNNGTPIAPCGAIANSMFNDSFTLKYLPPTGGVVIVPFYRTGIAWYTDKNVKFRNPQIENELLPQVFQGTAQPFYWQKPVYELDPSDPNNNGFINEDFIVWMREAAFPSFKKLYGILNRQSKAIFEHGLPAGNYSVTISYNFPAQYFQGKKLVVLSTVSWFGGKNIFLPIAYIVTGGVILVVAVVLTVVYIKIGKKGLNMEE